MPKFKLKHSSVAGKAPLPADLIEGELALNINSTSPAAYIKDSTGAIVKLAGAGAVAADATETVKGVVELATAAETTAGTDATRAVHPAGLKVELDKKAPLASPALTGVPTAPTAAAGTNTTQVATTAFVAGAQNWTRTGTTLAPKTAGDAVNISAGTAALPGLTPVGDPNTGIYAPAADTLAVSTNGTEKVRVTNDGKVGVGVIAPTGMIHVESSQYVGLQLKRNITAPGANAVGLRLSRSTGNIAGSFAAVGDGDACGSIDFMGADGTADRHIAGIIGSVDGTPAANSVPGRLTFSTTPVGGPAALERLRITSDGKVGIGTTAPTEGLHVVGTASVQANPGSATVFTIKSGRDVTTSAAPAPGTNHGVIRWRDTNNKLLAAINCNTNSGSNQGSLFFYTKNTTNDGDFALTTAKLTNDGYWRMGTGTGGIQFGGDTAAANALNDYEEGTFTPTIVGTTTAGAGTYTRQVGRYTKIGNRVLFNLFVTWTAHTGTGNLQLNGLPFTSSIVAATHNAVTIYPYNLTWTAGSTLISIVQPGTTYVQISQVTNSNTQAAGVPMDTAADICITGVYMV